MAEPRPIRARLSPGRLVAAYAWSAAVAVAGLWLWRHPHDLASPAMLVIGADGHAGVQIAQRLAVAAFAGGTLCFMWFVADDLCPDAPMELTGFLKGFAGAGFWLALGWAVALMVL